MPNYLYIFALLKDIRWKKIFISTCICSRYLSELKVNNIYTSSCMFAISGCKWTCTSYLWVYLYSKCVCASVSVFWIFSIFQKVERSTVTWNLTFYWIKINFIITKSFFFVNTCSKYLDILFNWNKESTFIWNFSYLYIADFIISIIVNAVSFSTLNYM